MDTDIQSEAVQTESVSVKSPRPGPSENRENEETAGESEPVLFDSSIGEQNTNNLPAPAPTNEIDTEGIRYFIPFTSILLPHVWKSLSISIWLNRIKFQLRTCGN